MDSLPDPLFTAAVQLWDFADAPEEFRRLVPAAYSVGWIAIVDQHDLAEHIISLSDARGIAVRELGLDNQSTLLWGPYQPGS